MDRRKDVRVDRRMRKRGEREREREREREEEIPTCNVDVALSVCIGEDHCINTVRLVTTWCEGENLKRNKSMLNQKNQKTKFKIINPKFANRNSKFGIYRKFKFQDSKIQKIKNSKIRKFENRKKKELKRKLGGERKYK